MKIINCWSLHYESFLIEIEGSMKEVLEFEVKLEEKFPDKNFVINRVERRDQENG